MYRLLFRLVLSKFDPEFAHRLGVIAMKLLRWTDLAPGLKEHNPIELAGIRFPNRFGMAAGFDKNGKLIRELGALGFGHVEIGTVTALAQPGNPQPRLFRLTKFRALINRMGFNNDGAEVVAARLAKLRQLQASGGLRRRISLPVIGVNIGKSKVVELEQAAADYEVSARLLAPYADYLAVNVSSPNTPGLRDLQQVESLRPILEAVLNQAQGKPVFVKIAPDLADQDALAIADLAVQLGLTGVIATNTTLDRSKVSGVHSSETGGLSGPPVAARSLELLKLLRAALPSSMVLISVGGVETEQDVRERLSLGADLVQGYTGFVYFGPFWPSRLAMA